MILLNNTEKDNESVTEFLIDETHQLHIFKDNVPVLQL